MVTIPVLWAENKEVVPIETARSVKIPSAPIYLRLMGGFVGEPGARRGCNYPSRDD